MADEADHYIGEFRRGPAIFTVFQTALAPRAFRVDCNDGNGPSEVCTFTDRPGSGPKWHGAWNGDEWCAWIELQARKTIKGLPTRVRRRGNPLSRVPRTALCSVPR